jgi:hypothetical protein
LAIAAATASLACLDVSSIATAEGAGLDACWVFVSGARGPLEVVEIGGTKVFWFTVNGTAGATLFDFVLDAAGFAALGMDVGVSTACDGGARASETGGLESTGGVGAFCDGTGVELLLVVLETALSLTGSSEVCLGGCVWPGGGGGGGGAC